MNALTVIPQMTHDEAETITEQITFRLDAIADNYEVVMPLIREAIERGAHDVLGYPSVGAYVSEQFGGALSRLGVEVRREVVRELSAAGMSTRAIAPVMGVGMTTVKRDLAGGPHGPGAQDYAPALTDAPGNVTKLTGTNSASDVAAHPLTGEVFDAPTTITETHTVKTITGLDGKTYPKAAPSEPRRRSLVDDAYTANMKLWEATERIRTITSDDRFTRNKADILAALQPSADLAKEILSDLFNPNEGEK